MESEDEIERFDQSDWFGLNRIEFGRLNKDRLNLEWIGFKPDQIIFFYLVWVILCPKISSSYVKFRYKIFPYDLVEPVLLQ